MFPDDVLEAARSVMDAAASRNLMISTAESCTGGLVTGAITALAGSSSVFERGFVTYSNEAKAQMLGVDEALILRHGAVSEQVAMAMAAGALSRSRAGVSVSVTGVAGPGGGSTLKPVGLVHFAAARTGGETVHLERRFGDLSRDQIRLEAVRQALDLLLGQIRA